MELDGCELEDLRHSLVQHEGSSDHITTLLLHRCREGEEVLLQDVAVDG